MKKADWPSLYSFVLPGKTPTTKGVCSAVFGYSSTVVIDIIVERRGSYITDIEGSSYIERATT
jgi:hypothetical protein